MPPLLLKLTFDQRAAAPIPIFVKPVALGISPESAGSFRDSEHHSATGFHGKRTRPARVIHRGGVHRCPHPDEFSVGSAAECADLDGTCPRLVHFLEGSMPDPHTGRRWYAAHPTASLRPDQH